MGVVMVIQGLLLMLLPVAVVALFARRRKIAWAFLGVGAGMFLLAQVPKALEVKLIGMDFNWYMVLPLATVPGVWEELFKWGPLKLLRPKNWRAVLDFGLGFGGIEAAFLGLSVLITGITAIAAPGLIPGLQDATVGAGLASMAVSLLERLFAMTLHVGFAFLCAQALKPGRWYYLLLAIAAHTLVDVPATAWQLQLRSQGFSVIWVELVTLALAAVSLWYIRRTLRSEGDAESPFAPQQQIAG
ncbi:MAG: YhfC family glutamic-type intramembrane protease [Mycobacterium leprae]